MGDSLMPKTWALINKTADKYKIKYTVLAVETAFRENESGLVIGHSKAIIEGIFKSILDEYKHGYPEDIKIGPLSKKAMDVFKVGNKVKNKKKTVEAFKKIISSTANHIENATRGIGELRNEFCPLAHGKSADHIPLELHYAEFIMLQTDSIIGLIHDLRESFITQDPKSEITKNSDFDEYLNEEFESVTIFENIYQPAEIIFNVAPEAYQTSLEEYEESIQEVTS